MEKQVPFGDDNQKNKYNGNCKYKSRSFAALRMTTLWRDETQIVATYSRPMNSWTSSMVGMDSWAPLRVTEMALAAEANMAASRRDWPSMRAAAKAPLKQS